MRQFHEIKHASRCPWCHVKFDLATHVGGKAGKGPPARPKEGDFTLCIQCGEWCVFTASGDLRKPTHPEFEEIAKEPLFRRMRQCWVEVTGKLRTGP